MSKDVVRSTAAGCSALLSNANRTALDMFPTTLLEDFVLYVWLRSRQARKFALLAETIVVSRSANSLRDGAADSAALPGQLETAEGKERFMAPCCKQNLEPNYRSTYCFG